LIALADAIQARAHPREHVVHRGEDCLLAYPEALTDLAVEGSATEAQALRQALWDAELIAVDPMRPFLKSLNIDGRAWLALVPKAGDALRAVLDGDAARRPEVSRSLPDPRTEPAGPSPTPEPRPQDSLSASDTKATQARHAAEPQAPVSRSAFDAEPRPTGASRSPRAAS
jgi:hypothetical protein